MLKNFKKVLDNICKTIGCILIPGIIIMLPIVLMTQCANDNEEYLRYGLSHPSTYIITYTDNTKDTISVWNIRKDEIWIHNDDNIIYIDYTPYKKYTKLPGISDEVRIYNVFKYKKIN